MEFASAIRSTGPARDGNVAIGGQRDSGAFFALPTAPLPTSFGPCCVNCANASCGERSSATKIRIDAPNDLDDQTCEMGRPRGIIEAPLDRVVGRAGGPSHLGRACVRGYGSPYTTSRAAVIVIACQKVVPRGQRSDKGRWGGNAHSRRGRFGKTAPRCRLVRWSPGPKPNTQGSVAAPP